MSAASPRQRVVLLGASNLTRSLKSQVSVAGGLLGEPLDVLCAAGHGRSYGVVSSFLFVRCLPSLRDCGIWDALQSRPRLPTFAWLGDIGNDLLHGYSAAEILAWVRECLQRLLDQADEVILCQLPLHSLSKLGRSRYRVLRALTYPRSRLPYETAMASIEELNEGIANLARERGVSTFVPLPDWYGFDPIHIRARSHLNAWQEMLSCWSSARDEVLTTTSSLSWKRSRLRRLRPQSRTLFGITQRQDQPALTQKDGSQLSLF